MATLNDLSARLNKIADRIEAAPSKVAAAFSLALIAELTERTPVDTSKAISNWLLSLNDPVLIDQDAHFEGRFGSTFTSSRQEVLSFAASRVAVKKPGQPIFLNNAAPYIRDLENGTSMQAPAGFVKQSIMAAKAKLPAIIKEALKNGR